MAENFHFDGFCDPQFESVQQSFKNNFRDGWEKKGAAVCTFYKGQKVVDLWGGKANSKESKLWKEDTLTTIFSCTKSITAICFAILVERGLCEYNDRIAKYWPAFGQNEKEEITIQMVLSHQAGLPYFRGVMELEDLIDNDRLSSLIENEKLKFEPGERTAYHPLTHGWITDQVFRRIDKKGRTVGVFYKEEIGDKYHLDCHIGGCSEEEERIATVYPMNPVLTVREFMYDKAIGKIGYYFYHPKKNFSLAMKNMRRFGTSFTLYNNPSLRVSGQPAVNGVSTARALAETHQLCMDNVIISKEMMKTLSTPLFTNEFDHTIGEVQNKGYGFMYTRSPMDSWQIGHMGVGGQIVKMDLTNEIVFVYLTNGMKAGSGEHVYTANRMQNRLYQSIFEIRQRQSFKEGEQQSFKEGEQQSFKEGERQSFKKGK